MSNPYSNPTNPHLLLKIIDHAARGKWTKLDLSNQGLTHLPPEIGQLTSLQTFSLRGNLLTTLSPELGQLTALQSLDLTGNRLTALPPEIGQLTALQFLDLTGNRLTTLPPAIGRLSRLTKLDLGSNLLTALPATVGDLAALKSFNLLENRLTSLPPTIGKLTALRELDLRTNLLTTLPQEVGNLSALVKLDLSWNQLKTLPAGVCLLSTLIHLDLSWNRLITLPPEIDQLTNLCYLGLRDNPNLPLPFEILEKSSEPINIIRAWSDYLTGQSRPLNEIKLVLVGEGSVGKTSLVSRLLHDDFDPNSEKTEGIAIHRWLPPSIPPAGGEEKGGANSCQRLGLRRPGDHARYPSILPHPAHTLCPGARQPPQRSRKPPGLLAHAHSQFRRRLAHPHRRQQNRPASA